MSRLLHLLICQRGQHFPTSFIRLGGPIFTGYFLYSSHFPLSITSSTFNLSPLPCRHSILNIEVLLWCPSPTKPAEPRLAGGGFCAVFATINYSSHPASSTNTRISNFDDCFAPLPGTDETFFQDGVEDYLDLRRLGGGLETRETATKATEIQSYFEDTESLLLLNQQNTTCLPTDDCITLTGDPDSTGVWTFDWTNSSNLPNSWDHNLDFFDRSRDYYASVNSNGRLLAPATIEGFPSNLPCNQWQLSSPNENNMSRPIDLSGPWSQFGTLHVTTNRFPSETLPELDASTTFFAMSDSNSETDANTSSTTEQTRSKLTGKSPQPLTSGPGETTATKQSPSIDCTWPMCKKSFPSQAAYNHHARYHTMSFQCPLCPKRQATKREYDRHINSVHVHREKYYCPVVGCSRSEAGTGKHFPREDGCSRHMLNKHGVKAGEMECRMDEQTRRIRKERKVRKKRGDE
ncbi:hypothetical protein ONS95_001557 [Cadophora gregata]|uniref:uncharacterized protein n=1 Tax=Cadophora gregata TaxID=51156 RepID=UPI0026DBC87E|nr:uncharacterized protein ONS95_001557 [Cadophora gregata]KAK0111181.1 hypothetical protein ONS95_001557 [Cadophora gregata]KAK0112348.1 hypothetical protein ONS96_001595 [Cadophora gregata f. sp. sojae]